MHEKERKKVGTGEKDRNGCQSKCLDTNKARSKYNKHDNTSPSTEQSQADLQRRRNRHTQTKERERPPHTHRKKKERKKNWTDR